MLYQVKIPNWNISYLSPWRGLAVWQAGKSPRWKIRKCHRNQNQFSRWRDYRAWGFSFDIIVCSILYVANCVVHNIYRFASISYNIDIDAKSLIMLNSLRRVCFSILYFINLRDKRHPKNYFQEELESYDIIYCI